MDLKKRIIDVPFVFPGGLDFGFGENWKHMKEAHTGELWFDSLAKRYKTRLNGVHKELVSAYGDVLKEITEHLHTVKEAHDNVHSMVQQINKHQDILALDVGAEIMHTSKNRHSDSNTLLATFAEGHFEGEDNFVNRDPTHWRDVLYGYPYAQNQAANRERVFAGQKPRPIDYTPQMLWQLICEKLLPLANTQYAWISVILMDGKENREIHLGTVYATQEGFQWYKAPHVYKNNDDMVYKYFEGKSGDGPLVLKLRKHGYNDQFEVSVHNLQQALWDRGITMKCYDKEDDSHYAIAIWREHIRATTLWCRNDGMEYTRADEYDTE